VDGNEGRGQRAKGDLDLQAAADFNRAIVSLVTIVANGTARPQWKQDSFFRRFATR
jgi:hypothetical protein